MTSFTFDVPLYPELPDGRPNLSERYGEAPRTYAEAKQELLDHAESVRDGIRHHQEERGRRISLPTSQVITLRMPSELVAALDRVAADAGATRGLLLRQITADYLNYVSETGVKYRGSLLSFRGGSAPWQPDYEE